MEKTYSTQEVLKNQANMKAWMFGHTLAEVLKEEMDDVKVTPMVMESDFIVAAYEGKSWRKDYGQHLRLVIENPNFKLEINALDENTVDLFSITVKKKRQGTGNDLMSCIMAVADELDINISLVPVAISSTNNIKRAEKAAEWLREWYDCMRFTECDDSPEMQYHAGWASKDITEYGTSKLNLKSVKYTQY